MARSRYTSSKGGLILGGLMGLFFTAIGCLSLYNDIQTGDIQRGLLFVIVFGLFFFILCTKGYIKLLKKKKIKKNKEIMRKIEAKIIGFEARNVNKETNIPRSYYFNASDGLETYSSEEFRANVVGGCGDITETLKMMQIPYNPEKKEDTIKAQNDRLNQIEMELQQHSGVKKLLLKVVFSATQILKGAYSATQTAKERLESGENPYMEFKGHKLSVGDQVSVYIDPDDPTNYRIDTDFLYI